MPSPNALWRSTPESRAEEGDAATDARTPLLEPQSASSDRRRPPGSEGIQDDDASSYEGDILFDTVHTLSGRKASASQSCLNLVNTIVGAGTMAIPICFSVLGLAGGAAALGVAVWIMAYSIKILVEVSWEQQKLTYGDLVERYLGKIGALLVRVSLVLTCLGFLIAYIIIVGDLLIGSAPDFDGLLPSLLGLAGSPMPWYMSRSVVLGFVVAVCLTPLTCLRSLERLSIASAIKCSVTALFCSITILACVQAGLQHRLAKVRWLPDFEAVDSSALKHLLQFLAVIPVVLTAYSCHFNVHPTMTELEHVTPWRMSFVVNNAIGISSVIFFVVGVTGVLCFGDDVKADVLQNFSVTYLQSLFGPQAGAAVNYLLKLGYFALLLCTYPLLNWPFRENALEIAGVSPLNMENKVFWSLTVVLNILVLVIALGVPSIWTALSIMGSTSSVMVVFVFPGLIQVLAADDRMDNPNEQRDLKRTTTCRKLAGGALALLGLAVGAAGIYCCIFPPW